MPKYYINSRVLSTITTNRNARNENQSSYFGLKLLKGYKLTLHRSAQCLSASAAEYYKGTTGASLHYLALVMVGHWSTQYAWPHRMVAGALLSHTSCSCSFNALSTSSSRELGFCKAKLLFLTL